MYIHLILGYVSETDYTSGQVDLLLQDLSCTPDSGEDWYTSCAQSDTSTCTHTQDVAVSCNCKLFINYYM